MPVSAEPQPRPVSLKRRLVGGAAALLAVVAAGLVATWITESGRGAGRLQAVLDHLDRTDPNWRLDEIEAAREEVPDHENSARVVATLHKALPPAWVSADCDRLLSESGPARPRLTPERLAVLGREMAGVSAQLARGRRLADLPRGRHQVTLAEHPYHTMGPHLQATREVAAWLALDAIDLARRGQPDEAVASCRASFNAARSLGDEPPYFPGRLLVDCAWVGGEAVESVLALGQAGDAELARLALLVADEQRRPALRIHLRGLRAALHEVMTGLGDGRFSFEDHLAWDALDARLVWRERLAGWDLRRQVRHEHPELLELLTRAVEASSLPPHQRKKPMADLDGEVIAFRNQRSRLVVPFVMPWMCQINDRFLNLDARLATLRTAIAVERYRLASGRWPGRLDDLVPAYLDTIPLDPADGHPLRYARHADGVVVYSVGLNARDDGGAIDRHPYGRGAGTDIGYYLWDASRRGPPGKGE